MSRTSAFDVIIAGAGPAGSATAAQLARAGFSTLLLDRAAFPREKACGEYTSPQSEEVLRRLGALGAIERYTRRIPAMHLISPSGRRFVLDYASAGGGPRYILATPRVEFDAALVDFARQCGAQVHERARVTGVTARDARVTGVVIREKDGKETELAARLVIGADGTHSVVARSLGATAPLRWPRNLGMVARYTGYKGLDDWGEMHVGVQGYAGLAPLANGLLNVGLVMPLRSAAAYNGMSAAQRFEAFASSFPAVANCLDGAERVTDVRGMGPIGARVSTTFGNGYLLVGDAAGFFDPFTGEGVYKALRGAELAAGVATAALERDDLSARSLSAYEHLRRREFGAKDLVCRMVQLFVTMPAAMDYVAGRLARRPSSGALMTGVLGDYTDPRSALNPAYLWSVLRP